MNVRKALVRLNHEYRRARREDNPPKQSIVLRRDGSGLPTAFVNFMFCRLSDGHVGCKLILVDEERGTMDGRVVVLDSSGELVCDLEAGSLTATRCALMAAYAIEEFYWPNSPTQATFGLLGSGRINAETYRLLRALCGAQRKILVKASPREPRKNMQLFEGARFIDDVRDFDVDVVISCTNARAKDEVVETSDFGDAFPLPCLFVAQDTGWLLGRSFRQHYSSFADDVDQLEEVAGAEFPWDARPPIFIGDLNTLHGMRQERACVYLYGIALADVVTALEIADGRKGYIDGFGALLISSAPFQSYIRKAIE